MMINDMGFRAQQIIAYYGCATCIKQLIHLCRGDWAGSLE